VNNECDIDLTGSNIQSSFCALNLRIKYFVACCFKAVASFDRIACMQRIDAAYCYRRSIISMSACWSQPCALPNYRNQSEAIEMSFVLWTRVCPGNHVLGRARIPWEGGNLWVSFGSQWTKVYRYSSPQCNIAKPLRELTCHMELRSVTCHPLFGWQVTGGCQIPLFRRWQQRCGLLLSVLQRLVFE